MSFVKAAVRSDIAVGTMKKITVGDATILLANIDGGFYALPNKCPHLGGSLADGKLEGGIVTCPRHGSRFDVKTGKAVGDPKILFITMKVSDTKSYPVRIDGEDVLVDTD
jgi:3-phenylpropionate/trans-cinnamate dioxygenase ferredoxin subunit